MKTLCVLLGANEGISPAYKDAASALGKELAMRNITLLYGGGRLGLMGVLATAVLENGGKVVGVITEHLHEVEAYTELVELHVVKSMHERKIKMIAMADGFLALPGGLGMLEEIFEIWNAAKINLLNKPIYFLNVNSYFDKLFEFISTAVEQGFLKAASCQLVKAHESITNLLDLFEEKTNTQEPSNVAGF